ncbi:MAG: murein L,D-transpeptidase [Desulfobacterales bacterium]|nr:murein L,D-transpeptidase [Desulfobacterales bacterium]
MFRKLNLYLILILLCCTPKLFSSDLIPDSFVTFSDNTEYAVVVDKELQKLSLYETKGLSKVLTLDCATGENKGRKKVEGDKKTPEGVYFFTADYEDKDLTPVYGTRAFPIDYPNVIDSLRGRNGDAIWLHGTDKKILIKRSSNGCIALNNKDVDKITPYLKLKNTPFIISKSVKYTEKDLKENKIAVKKIFTLIDEWKRSIENGSYHFYLSFYDSSYLPDISFWRQWIKMRNKIKNLSFEISNRSIIKNENYFVVTFDLTVLKGTFKGEIITRKLFLKDLEGTFKIIGDEYLHLLSKKRKIYVNFVDAIKKTDYNAKIRSAYEKKQKLISDIKEQASQWMKSWGTGDIKTYQTHYSNDFYSKAYKMNLNMWVKHKKSLKSRYKYIKISMKNLRVDIFKKFIKVTFTQIYNSSGYNETGTKKLFLKPEGDKWKIYRELWTKNY